MSSDNKLMGWLEANVFSCSGTVLVDDSFFTEVVSPCLANPEDDMDLTLRRIQCVLQIAPSMSYTARKTLTKVAIDLIPRLTHKHVARFYETCAKYIEQNLDRQLAEEVTVNCLALGTKVVDDDPEMTAIVASLLVGIHQSRWWTPTMIADPFALVESIDHRFVREVLAKSSSIVRNELSLQNNLSVYSERKEVVQRAFGFFCVTMHLASLLPPLCYTAHLQSDAHTLVLDASRQRLFESLPPTWYQEIRHIAKTFQS
ncbi:hypothetical protein OBBRIDRAFT_833482 [Obba rivulosa]|uniref:Uncharacterized protein n=1 Tax=Obba rivulosa TaxID=1052685 RepID=A0A8E2AWJ4_9APHY|nr:hypothetical protein OBBRIDRAFT_833482 [Obba rivulosa]